MHTGAVSVKTTRNTQGVQVRRLKAATVWRGWSCLKREWWLSPIRYRTKTLPAAGAMPSAEDVGEQLTLT